MYAVPASFDGFGLGEPGSTGGCDGEHCDRGSTRAIATPQTQRSRERTETGWTNGATHEGSTHQGFMPVTIQMILGAHESNRNRDGGARDTLNINGWEVSGFTLVAQLESVTVESDILKRIILNDASGRISVKVYHDPHLMTDEDELLSIGKYVRVFGTLGSSEEQIQPTCHVVRRVDDNSEIPSHWIEVAHTSLKLKRKAPAMLTAQHTHTQKSKYNADNKINEQVDTTMLSASAAQPA